MAVRRRSKEMGETKGLIETTPHEQAEDLAGRIRSVLHTTTFGQQMIVLPRTGSTNDVARELAGQGAREGTIVLAEEQTAGRGRLQRRWLAPPGTCLLLSILFRPRLPLDQAQWLTALCAMAAADAIETVAGLHVGLKWPNDLIVRQSALQTLSGVGRKLAGVLTETGVMGNRLDYLIVGIGINVNVPTDALATLSPEATSILAETGRTTDRATLLATLLLNVEERYRRLYTGEHPRAEWTRRLVTVGQSVCATSGAVAIQGIAEAVDETGALLIRTAEGQVHRLVAGDATLSTQGT